MAKTKSAFALAIWRDAPREEARRSAKPTSALLPADPRDVDLPRSRLDEEEKEVLDQPAREHRLSPHRKSNYLRPGNHSSGALALAQGCKPMGQNSERSENRPNG
jgi:hypothetical protein